MPLCGGSTRSPQPLLCFAFIPPSPSHLSLHPRRPFSLFLLFLSVALPLALCLPRSLPHSLTHSLTPSLPHSLSRPVHSLVVFACCSGPLKSARICRTIASLTCGRWVRWRRYRYRTSPLSRCWSCHAHHSNIVVVVSSAVCPCSRCHAHLLPAPCASVAGCILYELLCLKVPFEGGDLPRLINKILRASYPRPPAKYSKATHALVDSMLQKDPKVRAAIAQPL
jgi:hypothetical protein